MMPLRQWPCGALAHSSTSRKITTYMLTFHRWLNPMNMRTNRTKNYYDTQKFKNRTRNTWTFRIIQHELHAKYGYFVQIFPSHGASIWVPVPGFPGPFEAASPQRLPGLLVAFMAPHELLRSMAWGLHPLQVGHDWVGRVSPGWGWEMVTTRWASNSTIGPKKKPTCFRGVYGKYPGFLSGHLTWKVFCSCGLKPPTTLLQLKKKIGQCTGMV